MKKTLLIVAITLCIFQMVVLATAIDIGMPATDRGSLKSTRTIINIGNPANDSGKITAIEIWSSTNLSDVEVATFYLTGTNELSTRDTHNIGVVTSGSKQTFPGLSIDVEAGDYLGIYYSGGLLENDTSGGSGTWSDIGGDFIPCIEHVFSLHTGEVCSLYGIGTTAVGWDHKWNTLTISKWNTKEFTEWNDLE